MISPSYHPTHNPYRFCAMWSLGSHRIPEQCCNADSKCWIPLSSRFFSVQGGPRYKGVLTPLSDVPTHHTGSERIGWYQYISSFIIVHPLLPRCAQYNRSTSWLCHDIRRSQYLRLEFLLPSLLPGPHICYPRPQRSYRAVPPHHPHPPSIVRPIKHK